MTANNVAPDEIRVSKDRRIMTLRWTGEEALTVEAELLRVHSPSAEVQGHAPSQRIVVSGKKDVAIAAIVPIGNYAIRIAFDDGHDTGIFTWPFLRDMAANRGERFAAYEAELAEKGLSR